MFVIKINLDIMDRVGSFVKKNGGIFMEKGSEMCLREYLGVVERYGRDRVLYDSVVGVVVDDVLDRMLSGGYYGFMRSEIKKHYEEFGLRVVMRVGFRYHEGYVSVLVVCYNEMYDELEVIRHYGGWRLYGLLDMKRISGMV